MKKNDLTIILTLCGRHLHTLRWLWHANRIGFPYHVIIADGEVHPTIDRLLSSPVTFQNLSYEYHRHCDRSFSDFFRKWAESTGKVKTGYVMMSDNDDFPVVTGIEQSIAWLGDNSGYVCAGGCIPSFAVAPSHTPLGKVIGRMLGAQFSYQNEGHDISAPSLSERVLDEMNQYQTIHYHVYRTEALRVIVNELEVRDFSDLNVAEYYGALRAVTLGKVRSDASVICYLRQTGTSMLSTYRKHDWVHHLLRSDLPRDYRVLAAAIAGEVSKDGGYGPEAFGELILDAYSGKIRHMLAHTMLRHRFPRLFAAKQHLKRLGRFQVVPVRVRRMLRERKFWRRFADDCGNATVLAAYMEEFRKIEATLQGDEFLSFVEANAPDLMVA